VTGDHGLSLIEPAPFGVIGALTPSTNPTSTIICNAIGMLAAGNAVVFSVHPSAKECSIRTIALLNKAIVSAGGPPDVVTGVSAPSLESAREVMKHPGIRLLVVTGGGAVVRAAMASGKRAICAGPGNPPVVVDETADLAKAGRDIVLGGSTDNNVICVDEKEVLVVAKVADELIRAMVAAGAVLIGKDRLKELEKAIFTKMAGPREHAWVDKDLIGKNANVILRRMGISAPDSVRQVVVEVDADHPLLWTEQMMPVMPVCRVPSVDAAIDLAVPVEGTTGTRSSCTRGTSTPSRGWRRSATPRSSSRTAARRRASASTARASARSRSRARRARGSRRRAASRAGAAASSSTISGSRR
jgi:acetaldehyde dehydrogenase (EC 1.2.1.10)